MGILLAAAGVLAFEVLLTRVFSVIMWYHFASMAIAVTMFGLSAGGLLPFLLRRGADGELSPGQRTGLVLSSACFSLLPYAALLALARHPLEGARILSVFHQPYFEPFRTSGGSGLPAGDALWVGAMLLVFSLPFVGAGALFADAFSRRGEEGKAYLRVMGGSAAGVVAYLAAMQGGSGPAAFPLLAVLFLLSAAAFSWKSRRLKGLFVLLALALLACGIAEAKRGFAEIRFVRGSYEPALLWTRWDANSRVAVYPASDEESYKAWGMSPTYAGPLPEQIGMVVDDTGYTALFGTGKDPASLGAFRYNVASAGYRLRGGGKALVVGPGGGKDILCALASGPFAVTAVEVNPLVVRAAEREFGDFTGRPYTMPGVRCVVAEGRNFLASDRERYDVIQMTQVFGRIPPSAGAFTMTEDHLYTTEGFGEYLAHLSDNGVLTVTRFVYERRVWRMLAIAREALRALGVAEPAKHILAIRDRGLLNVMIRRTPWPPEEIAAARRFAEEMRFTVMIAPDAPLAGLPGEVLSGAAARSASPFDFSAPTDDRPFFYYTLKPSAFFSSVSLRGGEFDDRSVTMLRGFLLGAAALCALFLLLPAALLARRGAARPSPRAALYMFAIGVAFLVWEIVIIKRLTLLFGVPVLTFAVGLSLVLAASGLGGWYAGRPGCAPSFRRLVPALLAAAAWLLLAGPALTSLAGAALPVRFLAAVVFAAPPAFLMGMFFPSGLRRFGSGDPGGAPYYFAANGAASVLGAALTQLLALNFGYRVTTWVGGLLYLGCATLLRNAREEKG
jgi:hypothetical protein